MLNSTGTLQLKGLDLGANKVDSIFDLANPATMLPSEDHKLFTRPEKEFKINKIFNFNKIHFKIYF